MPQSYINQLKPVAIVMSANQIEVANGASCTGSGGKCPGNLRPGISLGMIDDAGSETLTAYTLELRDTGLHSDRRVTILGIWSVKCIPNFSGLWDSLTLCQLGMFQSDFRWTNLLMPAIMLQLTHILDFLT